MTRALVVGCGERVWKDVDEAFKLCGSFDAYYVVKLAGVGWQLSDFFYWVTLHPEFMLSSHNYCKQRADKGLPENYQIVAPLPGEVGRHHSIKLPHNCIHISYRWPGMDASGSSGLFAVKAAIDAGHTKVILAGVPMTKDKHFSRNKQWIERDSFIKGWRTSKVHYSKYTRSLSGGWTEELLGKPTKEWLDN